jgi:uncharacterized membrane protein HdeD (DUF308 family)
MLIVLTRNWWTLAIRGLAAIVFGILAIVWPGITLTTLVLLFGVYVIIDGFFAAVGALNAAARHRRWWTLLLEGMLGITAGILTLFLPGITALFLLYLIAFWAIVTGGFEIGTAIRLRKEIRGEWLMALSGIASLLFGLILLLNPGAGALALIWLIGAYAIAFGSLMLALALRLRSRQVPGQRTSQAA